MVTNAIEIKVQIEELREKLKIAYILDPKYRCSTCEGLRNVETQYFDIDNAPGVVRRLEMSRSEADTEKKKHLLSDGMRIYDIITDFK